MQEIVYRPVHAILSFLSVTEYLYTENEGTWVLGTGVTKAYTYGNSTWKDLLTGYNGSAVSFDASGNILSCNGKTFAWQGGHRLKSMTADGTSLSFEYNADGLRWKKTGGGATHLYGYRGTKPVSDKTGSDTLLFRYDSQGNILGFTQVTATSTEHYTYVKNLQGDVLGILNSSGTEIASYTYDAWGRVLTVTGSDLSLAERNPIRYRGYYYDSESQLYYLQSRYYDPELKRFISPDSYAQTYDSAVGANMFAYCGNCPIIFDDQSGHIMSGITIFVTLIALVTLAGCNNSPESYSGQANCYAYALGLENDPETGKPFKEKPTLGTFSNNPLQKEEYYFSPIALSTIASEKLISDGNALGITIQRCEKDTFVPEGSWKIALAFTSAGSYFHMWKQDEEGIWSSKNGTGKIQIEKNNPEESRAYDRFAGYYLVTPYD